MHFTNFYFHVLTTKDNAQNTATITYTIKLRFPHVGDYVDYRPDIPSSGYNLNSDKSGWDTNQIIGINDDPTEWRIMEIDENRKITKLLGIGAKDVYLYGSKGYNNGVYLLNDICKSRYGNSSLGATARSLNINDIEEKMNNVGIQARNSYKYGNVQYGTTKKYIGNYTKYPYIYSYEKYSGTGVSDISDGTQVITGNVDKNAQGKMNPNGKQFSDSVYSSSTSLTVGSTATSLTCVQTFYGVTQSNSYYDNTEFYNLIFETNTYFWLASRYTICYTDGYGASFGIRGVTNSNTSGCDLFYSAGLDRLDYRHIAAVVFLNCDIQPNTGYGTKENPYILTK